MGPYLKVKKIIDFATSLRFSVTLDLFHASNFYRVILQTYFDVTFPFYPFPLFRGSFLSVLKDPPLEFPWLQLLLSLEVMLLLMHQFLKFLQTYWDEFQTDWHIRHLRQHIHDHCQKCWRWCSTVNLFERGITDPIKVVRTALLLKKTEAAITEIPNEELPVQTGIGGGMAWMINF